MVECRGSRVIGRGSRVIGRGSKVEVDGQKSRSRVRSRGSKFKGRKWEILVFIIHFQNTTFLAFVVKILKVLLSITNFITVSTEHALGHN
jgi:hypothetical protein